MACFILTLIYTIDEFSFDKYHSKAEKIFRVVNVYNDKGVGEVSSSCPFPLGPALAEEYPDLVKMSVRFFNFQTDKAFIEYNNEHHNEKRLFYADPNVFEMFDWKFIKGDPKEALQEPFSIVITESMARKYFGKENPLGHSLLINERYPMKVTAIIEDIPANSHFQFDFLGSMRSIEKYYRDGTPKTWVWNPCWTYIELADKASGKKIDELFPSFVEKFFFDAEKQNVSLYVQPLTDIHLNSHLDYEIRANGDILNVYILISISVFLLLIACINFMNLTTAGFSKRMMEIGLKKVHGASHQQLIVQFISEALIVSFIALLISLVFIELSLPAFNDFTGKSVSSSILMNPAIFLSILGIGLVCGLLSGAYPAFYLSRFAPATLFQKRMNINISGRLGRKALVVIQFSIVIILIICTFTAFRQLRLMNYHDLGFKKENIVIIPAQFTPAIYYYDTFKEKALENENIEYVTGSDYIIGLDYNTQEFRTDEFSGLRWDFFPTLSIRSDFLETFDIKLKAGRSYKDIEEDRKYGILINESMVQFMGWESNEAALGQKFHSANGKERVIGVFKDFHARSLYNPLSPFVLNLKEDSLEIYMSTKYIAVRYKEGAMENCIEHLQKVWTEIDPKRPFEYFLLSDAIDEMYIGEFKLGFVSSILTALTVFIAAIGLLGLTSFMSAQRTREIAIRKVMGASTMQIVILLTKEYIVLLSFAIVAAWPLSYFLTGIWLRSFVVQINFDLFVYILSAAGVLLLAMFVAGIRAYFTAQKNPSKTLQHS